MSAFAAYWPASGRVEFWCGFPAEPGLDARGKGDGVGQLYALAQRAGELSLYDGKNIDAAAFIGDVVDDLQGQILMVGADRFRQAEAEQALQNAKLHLRMTWRGTGAGSRADGSYDIRATDRAITGRKLKIKPHLIAAEAIRASRLRFDTAGNPALSKEKRDSRIDIAVSPGSGVWACRETRGGGGQPDSGNPCERRQFDCTGEKFSLQNRKVATAAERGIEAGWLPVHDLLSSRASARPSSDSGSLQADSSDNCKGSFQLGKSLERLRNLPQRITRSHEVQASPRLQTICSIRPKPNEGN